MKKILFIITQSELGGAQRWVYDTASELNKQKYKVVVAAGKNQQPASPLLNKLAKQNIKTYSLRYLRREINPITDLLSIGEIYKLLKKERPDIVQLCSTKAGFVGSIAARFYRYRAPFVKVLYRIGGWSFNDPRPKWQKKLFISLEKATSFLKDKIIVNSNHDYQQALAFNITAKNKLALLYNGIRLTEYQPAKHSSLNHNNVIIGTIANFYPAKGLIYLLKAVKILRRRQLSFPLQFLIIGDGRQRRQLEHFIKQNQLEKQIQLLGTKEDPWQTTFDIIVIPSVKEGFPYVLLEAMAQQLPIIATSVGAIPEIVSNNESALIVPPKNPRALAGAIETLIKNPALKTKIAQQAFNKVKNYSLKKMIFGYEAIIDHLTQNPKQH